MPIHVSSITDSADFTLIAPMDYIAWLSPPNPQRKHFRPTFPTPAESQRYFINRETRILERLQREDAEGRERKEWRIKAVLVNGQGEEGEKHGRERNGREGEIVGYAVWAIDNPSQDGDTIVTWYPEHSVERDFATLFINGLWRFIASRVPGPHLSLHSIVVSASQRRAGAGRALLSFGIQLADELGLPIAISSLPSARGFYERCGFVCVEMIPPAAGLDEKGKEMERDVVIAMEGKEEAMEEKRERLRRWKELEADDLSGWFMWRGVKKEDGLLGAGLAKGLGT